MIYKRLKERADAHAREPHRSDAARFNALRAALRTIGRVVVRSLFAFASAGAITTASAQDVVTGRLVSVVHDPQTPTGIGFEEFTVIRADGSAVRVETTQLNAQDRQRLSSIQGSMVTMRGASVSANAPLSARPIPSIRASSFSVAAATMDTPQGTPLAGNVPYAVVMCRFSDRPETPNTVAAVQRWMTGAFPSVDDFYREQSGNRVNLAGTRVFGWFNMTNTYNYYYGTDFGVRFTNGYVRDLALRDDCLAAAGTAVNVSTFAGVAIQHNVNTSTSYAYLAPITLTRDGVTKNYYTAYMADWATQVGSVSVYAHEFGHNFGLNHSGANYGNDYDSSWDVMSNAYPRYDNALAAWIPTQTIGFHKDQLNWIPQSQRIRFDVPVNGSIVLGRSALPSSTDILYAEIPILNQPGFSYTLEYRQRATAYEQGLPFDAMIIHKVDHAGNRARIVDVDNNNNPNDASSAWTLGETFTDPTSGISVAVVADLGQALRVNVTPGIQLSVTGSGNGGGNVTSAGGISYPIQCAINNAVVSGSCLRFYHPAETVTLTATPTSGNQHAGWTGACTTGPGTTCTLPMSQVRNVTAVFTKTTTPSQLALAIQPSATSTSGQPITVQPVIELRDATNQPAQIAGVPITVAKTAGSGLLSGTMVVNTNTAGRAVFTNLVLTGNGAHVLTFTSPGLASANANSINVSVAAATQVAILTQPSNASTGTAIPVQPVVEIRDAANQPFAIAGLVITASKASGAGVLSGTVTATTNAQGRATFSNLTITGVGAHTLSFASTGLVTATSASFTVSSPVATQLAYVTHPSDAQSGQPFPVQPVVELRDANGSPVAQAGVVVTIAKSSGTGTLSGTLTATTNAQGRAIFSNLQIVGSGAHALVVSATGIGAARSIDFNVTNAQPAQLAMASQPAGATRAETMLTQPVIELRDAQNRSVPQAGVVVTVARTLGAGTLVGTTTATTDAFGRATFTNLAINGIGNHALEFSATGLTSISSATFNVTEPVPTQIAMTVEPTGATTGLALSTAPEVELRTMSGKPLALSGVSISVARSSGTSVLSGPTTATTDARGRASFPGLIFTGTGTNRLTFSATGLSSVTSNDIVVGARPQCAVVVAAGNGGTVTGGSSGDCGRTETVQATANAFYSFTNWTENGTVVSTANQYTFTITGNRSLIANFSADICTLTISAVAGGTATISAGGATGQCGRQVTVTATPNPNFGFTKWTEGAEQLSTASVFTFSLTANRSMAANFVALQCAITLDTPSGGTIAISAGGATGNCGRSVSLVATPTAGNVFASWTENGSATSTSNPYTFVLNSPVTISATFNVAPIDPQDIATRLAAALMQGSQTFTTAERQWIDTQGNKNDLVDLGDFVALLQKNPAVRVNFNVLNSVLTSPAALQLKIPVKDTTAK